MRLDLSAEDCTMAHTLRLTWNAKHDMLSFVITLVDKPLTKQFVVGV